MAIASAIIGGALAAGGSLLASKSSNKAASKAATVAKDTSAANNALAREQFAKAEGYLSPYARQGVGASNALNDFYGLTPQQPTQQTMQQPNALSQFMPSGMIYEGMDGAMGGYGRENSAGEIMHNSVMGTPFGAFGGGFGGGIMQTQQQPQLPSSADAFKRFIGNSDYAFQFGEGANRVNSGFAGAGTLQSGAAMKAIEDYRQNLQAGYRGEWANGVANQQGVGLAGASAMAGVGQNFVNTVSSNNNNAGTAAANAALAKQNGLANALGMFGGSILSGGIKF